MSWIRPLLLALLLIPVCVTDLRRREIPNLWCLLIGLSGLLLTGLERDATQWVALGLGFFAAWVLAFACRLVTRTGFGLGDVKLLLALGVYMKLGIFLRGMVFTGFLTLAAAMFLLLVRHAKEEDTLPMAPFVSVGAVLSQILESLEGSL